MLYSKNELDRTVHAVLSYCNFYLNTLRDFVTLTFDLLTLEPCNVMPLECSIPVLSLN